MNKNVFDELAQALEVLPNIGPVSARRMAFYLLQHQREDAVHLIHCLEKALKQVHHCKYCNTFCEEELCDLCQGKERDQSVLMVVQMPLDVQAIEAANCYKGLYFVLMGGVQPLLNKDLNHIALQQLKHRLQEKNLKEVIIGTNFNAEGETTAFILQELLKLYPVVVTRLAHGIPLGGELEYVDSGTIAQSFYQRNKVKGNKT